MLVVSWIVWHSQSSLIPIFAHDGSTHTSDLEVAISGVGLLILAGCLGLLVGKLIHMDREIEMDDEQSSSSDG